MTPRLTAIGSGKGGTGKTLIAVSLAHSLAHSGERVLLCDADLGLSNAAVHLGLDDGGRLASVLMGDRSLADATVPVLGGTMARGGFDLLSAPAGTGTLANATADDARRLLVTLRAAQTYDRIILDLSAGVNDTTMMFACAADETLLVMTPDPAALTDAYAFVKLMMRHAANALPKVAVNVTNNETQARRTFEALSATVSAFLKCDLDYLGGIPYDAKAVDAVRRQSQLLSLYPQAEASVAIEAIARSLHRPANKSLAATAHAGLR